VEPEFVGVFPETEELLAGNYSAFRTALCGERGEWVDYGEGGAGGLVTRFNDSTFLDFDSSRGRKERVQVAGPKGLLLGKGIGPLFVGCQNNKVLQLHSQARSQKPEKVRCKKRAKRQKVSMNVKVNK